MAYFYSGTEFSRFQVEVFHTYAGEVFKLLYFFCYSVKCLAGHIFSVIVLHILQHGLKETSAQIRPHYFHPLSVMTALTICVCGTHLPARCSDTAYSAISESTSRGSISESSSPVCRYAITGSCTCEDSPCLVPLTYVLSFFFIPLILAQSYIFKMRPPNGFTTSVKKSQTFFSPDRTNPWYTPCSSHHPDTGHTGSR